MSGYAKRLLTSGNPKKSELKMTESEKLLTFREVQERLAISQATLFRLVTDKKIEAYRVGQQWRFSEAQVQEYLDKNRQIADED